MPASKVEKVILEPGVYLLPETRRVCWEEEKWTWPLPNHEARYRMHHSLVIDTADRLTASTEMAAYERMIFMTSWKRQRVVRALRKAAEWMAVHMPEVP